jgi:hypothetical protein
MSFSHALFQLRIVPDASTTNTVTGKGEKLNESSWVVRIYSSNKSSSLMDAAFGRPSITNLAMRTARILASLTVLHFGSVEKHGSVTALPTRFI